MKSIYLLYNLKYGPSKNMKIFLIMLRIFALPTSDGRSFDGIDGINVWFLGNSRQSVDHRPESSMVKLAHEFVIFTSWITIETNAVSVAHPVDVISQRSKGRARIGRAGRAIQRRRVNVRRRDEAVWRYYGWRDGHSMVLVKASYRGSRRSRCSVLWNVTLLAFSFNEKQALAKQKLQAYTSKRIVKRGNKERFNDLASNQIGQSLSRVHLERKPKLRFEFNRK